MISNKTDQYKPRFEFRIFERDLSEVFQRIEQLLHETNQATINRYSEETYFLNPGLENINCKSRNNTLDIKQLIDQKEGLERWYPVYKHSFPLPAEEIQSKIYPLLHFEFDTLFIRDLTFVDWKNEFNKKPGTKTAFITKNRKGFMLDEVICEYATVSIGSVVLKTVACESVQPEKVLQAMKILKLLNFKNTNYPRAIIRVLNNKI